jgi:bifunctional enzyme CysN/CysC
MRIPHVALVTNSSTIHLDIISDLLTKANEFGLPEITICSVSLSPDEDNCSVLTSQCVPVTPLADFVRNAMSDYTLAGSFRMHVESAISFPEHDTTLLKGPIYSGEISVGETVVVLPDGQTADIREIVDRDAKRVHATYGEIASITVGRALAISKGALLASTQARPQIADQFAAHIVWLGDRPLLPGRTYDLHLAGTIASAQVTDLKYAVNPATLAHEAVKQLKQQDVGFCNLFLDRLLPIDTCVENRHTGLFFLYERLDGHLAAIGFIDFVLRRATNIHWQKLTVDKTSRSAIKGQRPCVLWFTGLSGSGKSTVADLVEQELQRRRRHTMTLDGDNVRHGLNRDLGFTEADRVENVRRVSEVTRLMVEAGLIVLVSFISPFRMERRMARELVGTDEFLEVFVDAPIELCEKRDPKGLYKKARAGKLPNFTGIDSPYEPPENPEIVLRSADHTPEMLAMQVITMLESRGVIPSVECV